MRFAYLFPLLLGGLCLGAIIFFSCTSTLYEYYPTYSVTGKVASCTYNWLDSSTKIVFSGQGSYRFSGNYNLQVGANYTITYKDGMSGYVVLDITIND